MPTSVSTFRTDNWELRSVTELIDVTSNMPRRDPNWEYTDKEGHKHVAITGAVTAWPTLEWIVDKTYWCDTCRDEHEDGHWQCKECGEEIHPGMLGPSGHVEYARGRTSYYLNDEEITEDEATTLIATLKGPDHA